MKIPKFILSLFEGALKHIFYVAVVLGLLFLAIGYAGLFYVENENWKEVFKVAGTITLSSGVFVSITKSPLFLDIFKNALIDIVYDSKHLDTRNDINEIWQRTSESLCKRKFATINNKVFETIKTHYLPFEKEFYYKRFDLEATYEFIDDEPDYIKVEDELTADIVADDPDGYDYKFRSTIPLPPNDNGRTNYNLIELSVNGKKIEGAEDKGYLKITRTDSSLTISFRYHFNDKAKEYKIIRRDEKVYHFNSNPYRSLSASWLYKAFNVTVNYPKNLKIHFDGFGVLGKWTINDRSNHVVNKIKANYNSLIFKNQGFMMVFRKL